MGQGTDVTLPGCFCPQRWHLRKVTVLCLSQGLPNPWSCLLEVGTYVVARTEQFHPWGTSAPGTVGRRLLCFPWAMLLSGGSLAICPVLPLRGLQSTEATSLLLTGRLEQLHSHLSALVTCGRGEVGQEVIVSPDRPTYRFPETNCKGAANTGTTASRLPIATSEDSQGSFKLSIFQMGKLRPGEANNKLSCTFAECPRTLSVTSH